MRISFLLYEKIKNIFWGDFFLMFVENKNNRTKSLNRKKNIFKYARKFKFVS